MARLLVVEDDPEQLAIRKLVLESEGHEVWGAASPREARAVFAGRAPEVVVMDLRLPRTEDGRELIQWLREASATVRILVLSGWPAELRDLPEAPMVDQFLAKPVRTQHLLEWITRLCAALLCAAALEAAPARTFRFHLSSPAEVAAALDMSAPGADWGVAGREASLAALTVPGRPAQHVMLYAGAARHRYTVFLGSFPAGEHRLTVARDPRYSAPPCGLEVHGVEFRELHPGDPGYAEIAHAPILFARANTIGKFTDVPLLVYCERAAPASLRYTVIFSNEDGGTNTRGLMARWGRTTDIEHVYDVTLDRQGRPARALIQTRGHKDVVFTGPREDFHPLLIPVTDNNMVSGETTSPIRYQIAPVMADLSAHSREKVMDGHPVTWRVMAQELARERRGVEPRDHLYFELKARNQASRFAIIVRRRNEPLQRASHRGMGENTIERSGWVRLAVEMPSGTRAADIAEAGFECFAEAKTPGDGVCTIEAVNGAFFLDRDYRPQPPFWSLPAAQGPWRVPAGQARLFPVN